MIILREKWRKISPWRKYGRDSETAIGQICWETTQGLEKRWYWLHHRFGEDQIYYYPVLAQTFLTTSPGSQQTFTSPANWDSTANTVEAIGGGGSGSSGGGVVLSCPGASGAVYAKITNFVFASPGTTTAGYQIGVGGAGVTNNTSGGVGNDGGDTWFNGTSFATGSDNTRCNAERGHGGPLPSATGANGAAAPTTGWGQTINAGGRGGNAPGSGKIQGAGGGGAGGPNAAGTAAGDVPVGNTNASSPGGQGDGTFGGAGGPSGTMPGSPGTEWDSTHGSGGGGAGSGAGNQNTVQAGDAGLYGAASGAGSNGKTSGGTHQGISGAGAQGIIVLTWTPTSGGGPPPSSTLPFMGVG